MARLSLRPGVNPDEPDVPVMTLVVDPDGPSGERAVARLGDCCYEGDQAFFLVGTDGFAEHTLDGDRLVVDLAVYPSVLARIGVDAAPFDRRSRSVPEAVLVLSAETVVDRRAYEGAAPVVAVFVAPSAAEAESSGAEEDDWPMVVGLLTKE
ncbi:hypothetical protein ACFVIM_10345 [Streptomyces sp. NPDC057638]|uniref:hypothetical protein n=1 Tax=Streptomyces sp. NPDC057638 TaxID=3346190 RepID=UPI0036A87C4B